MGSAETTVGFGLVVHQRKNFKKKAAEASEASRLARTRARSPHARVMATQREGAKSSAKVAVVIFARLPTPGKAKTRLAASVGDANAAEFYRRTAERVFASTSRCDDAASRTLFFSDPTESNAIANWLARCDPDARDGMRASAQKDVPDLGERMRDALNRAMSTGVHGFGAEKAVVVGTDVPDLSAEHITLACRALDDNDVVFGPAEDGGYYLVGVRRRRRRRRRDDERDDDAGGGDDFVPLDDGDDGGAHPALFADIPWSTATVLEDSVRAAESAGLDVAPRGTLPTLRDVDVVDDVARWAEERRRRDGASAWEEHPLRECAETLLKASAEREASVGEGEGGQGEERDDAPRASGVAE